MLVFDICSVRVCCDISFFAVLALFFYFDNGSGLTAFLGCIFHELGHLIAMCIYRVRISSLCLYGGGIRLTSELESVSLRVKLAVCVAGCAANIALASVGYVCHAYMVSAVNILLAAVNLLPFGKLDGARIAELLCIGFAAPDTVCRKLKLIKVFSAAVAVVLLLLIGVRPDITLIVFCVYLVFLDKLG